MAIIGFIGIGNMGYAMLKGTLSIYQKDDLIFSCQRSERKLQVSNETGVKASKNNQDLVETCKYIILAIKPQVYGVVLNEIKELLTDDHVLISIAPGVSTDNLLEIVGQDKKVVRAMPNTPALVKEGMSGVCYGKNPLSDEEKKTVMKFFKSFGECEIVDEKLMNTVVCASGSSPAYVYMFIEALADSSVKYGMPREKAYRFAAQAVLGSAKMVLETGEHPGKLKDNVCSPGGTTIAAVTALEENGLRNAVLKAGDACYKKASGFKK